ncbi:hypothetical protein P3S67_009948 [Capsicum chacoense]
MSPLLQKNQLFLKYNITCCSPCCELTEQLAAWDNQTNNQGVRKRTMGRKTSKKHAGVNVDHTVESVSGGNVDDNGRPRKDNKTTPVQQTSFVSCCQAIAVAVCAGGDFPKFIVPRILFLEIFFCSRDKSNWSWPHGTKIHIVGSLILQSIFRLPSELIQVYVTSITSLEEHHVLEASKDSSGSWIIESFLNSNISAKQKRKLVAKLQGHFGELSVHPFGSFTAQKCFTASNLNLRETLVSEMLPLQAELSKTKQGPFPLRKLDIDGFARQPDQWKSRQASQHSVPKEFYATFGPAETKSFEKDSFLADSVSKSKPGKLKDIRKEIETSLPSAKTSNTPFLAHQVSKKVKRSKTKKKRHRKDGESESQRKKIKV